MAIPLWFQLLVHLLLVSTTTATEGGFSPYITPFAAAFVMQTSHLYLPALFAAIFSALGFQELSTATASVNLSATTLLTIFAPSDASLITCPSCSLPLLLRELSLLGLYPLHFLKTIIFDTKIETLAPQPLPRHHHRRQG